MQSILDCLPVSVITETVYSYDQLSHSCSNPYKVYLSDRALLSELIVDTRIDNYHRLEIISNGSISTDTSSFT